MSVKSEVRKKGFDLFILLIYDINFKQPPGNVIAIN